VQATRTLDTQKYTNLDPLLGREGFKKLLAELKTTLNP
jgi:hypothetical protein